MERMDRALRHLKRAQDALDETGVEYNIYVYKKGEEIADEEVFPKPYEVIRDLCAHIEWWLDPRRYDNEGVAQSQQRATIREARKLLKQEKE